MPAATPCGQPPSPSGDEEGPRHLSKVRRLAKEAGDLARQHPVVIALGTLQRTGDPVQRRRIRDRLDHWLRDEPSSGLIQRSAFGHYAGRGIIT